MSVDAQHELLRWYDVHRRELPWRAEIGEQPDPYRVWLSEIMLQQTTVAAVRPYFETFTRRWPTVAALAAADDGDVMAAWAGLGYYARARNLLACARLVTARGGFPEEEASLRALPGIGPYTAAAVRAIGFGHHAVAVDANVERVVARLFAVEEPLPQGRKRLHELAMRLTPQRRSGDFAQALMDLGSTICTPRTPDCSACPLAGCCVGHARGNPGRFPIKALKKAKPRRIGMAYWLEREGKVMLIRRPDHGLFGGMLALPTSAWAADVQPGEGAPAATDWQNAGTVEHVFTHFSLTIRLFCGHASGPEGEDIWWPVDRIDEAGLPSLFAKLAQRGAAWRRVA